MSNSSTTNSKIFSIDIKDLELAVGENSCTAVLTLNGKPISQASEPCVIVVTESGTTHGGGSN